MRAISLWQPWASLWVSGRKVHETRDWFTAYRGELVVHAAKRRLTKREYESMPRDLHRILEDEFGGHWAMDLPYGALIGSVDVSRCVPATEVFDTFWFEGDATAPDDYWCGDFSVGRYAWRAEAFHPFKRPLPWLGRQGFFDVPNSVVRELLVAA